MVEFTKSGGGRLMVLDEASVTLLETSSAWNGVLEAMDDRRTLITVSNRTVEVALPIDEVLAQLQSGLVRARKEILAQFQGGLSSAEKAK